ncbi:MAG: cation efflux protein [Candidatus Mesenet longicola]|uniref:Cation efflux protein n=1 Tax=Candidatus Mesenet longicola TaxID=1892558 RepID=A0A8J3HQ17_9RICK|nr:MAG: cation efflux protein [Candidatus Mesenet longicola]GHM59518.1 MAG: cation efflux protein [Candidatus Mesenet longicola]
MTAIHNGKHSSHSKSLIYAIIIIAVTAVLEVVGGVISNSLALLSDAGHMLTDLISLILSWFAYKVATKKSDLKRSYGYHRIQVVAAFVNGLTLFLISGIIIFESIKRFISPVNINWQIMFSIATIGLIANILAFFLLYKKDEDNLNIKSAVLHITGDILGSLAAIAASFIIMYTNWQIVDPILSVFVSIVILRSAYKIVKHSCHILLEGTPKNINPDEVKSKVIQIIPEVIDVHHVHIWSLTENYLIITAHIKVCQGINYNDTIYNVKKLLCDIFSIAHATVEIEYDQCVDDKLQKAIT